MKTPKSMIAVLTVIMVLASIPLITIGPPISANYVVAQSSRDTANKSIEITYAKVQALEAMLANALALNISAKLKNEIESLLAVNTSNLSLDELREWIKSASSLLSRVASEIRGSRGYRVGIVLERYLNGLRIALENRIRVLARVYNVSIDIDKVITNATQARDVNLLLKMYRNIVREVEVRRTERFTEAIRRHVGINVTAVINGEVKALYKVVKNLDNLLGLLNITIEKLKAMNISESAVGSLEEARDHMKLARELIEDVSREVAPMVQDRIRERVREAVNRSLEVLIKKANNSVNEILEELSQLRDKAVDSNLTEIVVKIDNLIMRIEEIRGTLLEAATVKDVYTTLGDLARIKRAVKAIEKEIDRAIAAMSGKLGKRIAELADKTIRVAKEKLEKVEGMLEKIRSAMNSTVCKFEPTPTQICRVVRNAEKLLLLVEERVDTARTLISKAEELYEEGIYTKALAHASKALGILNSAEHQLNVLEKLLDAAQRRDFRK
ncbi:MAG: hypothetical protein N3D82_05760 [Ignisphaera sp.]|nr:hypothetical protein [Ignisphaera sp.]MCX8168511.1 hypothetical protein [Ignisphaera sp.]MDW8085049.1 hypothetical protein [Ignisphaera sp.]